MTVTYTAEVATCRGFGCFLKLLLRWRGSIYKLVWVDLVTYLSAYYALNFLYRFYLDDEQKKIFVGLVLYASLYTKYIPISFVLGFYVTIVVKRWWEQYTTIPKPNSISLFVSSYIIGQDERGRLMRRTIVRYVCLCITMVLIRVAPRVKKRFPTLQRLVEAGLLTDSERTIIAKMDERFPRPSKHWMPIVWAASIVTRARKEGLIRDDFAVKTLIDQLNSLRDSASILLKYDTITIPLVYTQVVTLAVYSYCAANILASQWFESSDEGKDQALDVYFPFFSTLQFFFYMGWLKVAEVLINPFGKDDEDFEVNWMIDENLKGCYMIVDEMHHEHPELMKDQYWDEVFPNELPGAEEFHEQHPEASTSKLEIPEAEAHLTSKLPPKIIVDDMVRANNQRLKKEFFCC
uniref:Bestrophin homolog n=1 Tax=Lutzomyia longipalpis TaxID=7200 RepID=A0A7G3AEN6_LUTLO